MTDAVVLAGDPEWVFPDLGEPTPERSDAQVLLLTAGGICIRGHWDDDPFIIAWARFPKRNREKETRVAEARERRRQEVQETAPRDQHPSGSTTGSPDSSSPPS